MLTASCESAESSFTLYEGQVTRGAESDLFPDPEETIDVGPAVEGDAQGVVFQHSVNVRKGKRRQFVTEPLSRDHRQRVQLNKSL